MSLVKDALELAQAGINVVPLRMDGSKAPIVPWTQYRNTRPTTDELKRWFSSGNVGMAVVCGLLSEFEVLDIDAPELVHLVTGEVDGTIVLPAADTPSGGRHLYWRTKKAGTSMALAKSQEGDILVETRGEGGLVTIPPSGPRVHRSGKPYRMVRGTIAQAPYITPQQRVAIIDAALGYNQYHSKDKQANTLWWPTDENRVPWDVILVSKGWSLTGLSGVKGYWSKPGTTDEVHATTDYYPGKMYIFSTSCPPFDEGRAYSQEQVVALLYTQGNIKSAREYLKRVY